MNSSADAAGADYVRRVLDAYRKTPGTTGHARPANRRLARDLYTRGVPLETVLDAFLPATARRYRSAQTGSPPVTVRSLAYFAPIVDEVLGNPLGDGYRRHLAAALDRVFSALDLTR